MANSAQTVKTNILTGLDKVAVKIESYMQEMIDRLDSAQHPKGVQKQSEDKPNQGKAVTNKLGPNPLTSLTKQNINAVKIPEPKTFIELSPEQEETIANF